MPHLWRKSHDLLESVRREVASFLVCLRSGRMNVCLKCNLAGNAWYCSITSYSATNIVFHLLCSTASLAVNRIRCIISYIILSVGWWGCAIFRGYTIYSRYFHGSMACGIIVIEHRKGLCRKAYFLWWIGGALIGARPYIDDSLKWAQSNESDVDAVSHKRLENRPILRSKWWKFRNKNGNLIN